MSILDALPERVERVEQKLDALSVSVDRRFDEVDQRFDEVDKRFEEVHQRFESVDSSFDDVSRHFVEQREYVEFAFGRLERRMVAGLSRLEQLWAVDSSRLARVERKLDQFIDRAPHRRRAPSSTRRKKR